MKTEKYTQKRRERGSERESGNSGKMNRIFPSENYISTKLFEKLIGFWCDIYLFNAIWQFRCWENVQHLNLNLEWNVLTCFTTSFKIAALSGLGAFMSRLLMWINSFNCSMYSFSCSRRRFSLLHLLICDCGYKMKLQTKISEIHFQLPNGPVDQIECEFTLLSGRLRIFFDAAGGHATADATAFIIFVWFKEFWLICWLFGDCCCTCVCNFHQ